MTLGAFQILVRAMGETLPVNGPPMCFLATIEGTMLTFAIEDEKALSDHLRVINNERGVTIGAVLEQPDLTLITYATTSESATESLQGDEWQQVGITTKLGKVLARAFKSL